METLEYDHQIFSAQQAEADKALAIRFFQQPLKDDERSTKEGRPIYVDTDMIEIRVRGDRNNIVVRPVRADDKERFHAAWAAYQRKTESRVEGTPLAEWPVMGASMVEELKHLGFFTVEQVAEASDGVCAKVSGLSMLKQKAKVFLEYAKGAAPLEQMQSEVARLKAQSDADQRNLADMSARLTEMERKYNALLEERVAGEQAKKTK